MWLARKGVAPAMVVLLVFKADELCQAVYNSTWYAGGNCCRTIVIC